MNSKLVVSVLFAITCLLSVAFADTPVGVVPIDLTIDTIGDAPHCWMDPETRVVLLNPADGSLVAVDRRQNYAFQGEQIIFDIVCQDRNGHEDINNVHISVIPMGDEECLTALADCNEYCQLEDLPCDYEEVECFEISRTDDPGAYGARDENGNYIMFDPTTMLWYTCALSVETSNSMYGEYWIVAEACDKGSDGTPRCGHTDEVENWCLNPLIQVETYPSNGIEFGNVLPGTRAYSNPLHIINVPDPECEGGAMLRMLISGTDFYDSSSSGARCPYSNVLRLENFAYYATQGAYSTWTNFGSDMEGYDTIPYETGNEYCIGNFGRCPIIDDNPVLAPGSELTIIFRLDLPRPCIGNFDSGAMFFWGEAV